MTLNVTNLIGFGAGGEAPNLTYLGGGFTDGEATTVTYTDQIFGAPHPDRWIIIAASSGDGGVTERLWNSGGLQINGSAADQVFCLATKDALNQSLACIFGSAVPNGGTGSFRLAYNGAVQFHHVAIYRLIGLSGGVAYATNTASVDAGTTATLSLNVPANGCLIGTVQWDQATSVTWVGATELVDYQTASSEHGHAYVPVISSAETPRTVTATIGVSDYGAGCAASFAFG